MSKNNRSLAFNLVALATGMLMLAYASVPLYRLFCQVTGYGGTTQQADHAPTKILDRPITIRFNADIDPKLPWKFAAGEPKRTIKIGQQGLTYYVAENNSDKPVIGRAIYNVVPHEAGQYFVKIDCFCFEEQTLQPGEKVNMPVSFYIDPAIVDDPDIKDVNTITLSYTFFLNKE
ncbi:MAG: cytochrome c oxidase assembly protein [Rickettsiales bacterium]